VQLLELHQNRRVIAGLSKKRIVREAVPDAPDNLHLLERRLAYWQLITIPDHCIEISAHRVDDCQPTPMIIESEMKWRVFVDSYHRSSGSSKCSEL
jgi:hypothetical protein